eukprot:TRINITY_DN4285_c0_g1_i7.p1 TRINITY_DN4285_c0_g1~~TRINITY_DN4285_c0_g1_i7.p1  ORF type:complete len:204 (-),score=60.16 TRINITY_DN4285_c0_g1_i7:19-630(-)
MCIRDSGTPELIAMKADISQLNFINLLPEAKDFDSSFKLIDDFVFLPTSSAELAREMDLDEAEFQFEVVESYVMPKEEIEWVDVPTVVNVRASQDVQAMLEAPFHRPRWWKKAVEGFPNDMRGEIWTRCITPKSLLLKEQYLTLLNEKADPRVCNDIEQDSKRTFSFIPKFLESQKIRLYLSLIHICRCRRYAVCRSRWSPYH